MDESKTDSVEPSWDEKLSMSLLYPGLKLFAWKSVQIVNLLFVKPHLLMDWAQLNLL